jgi:hypothetical protein
MLAGYAEWAQVEQRILGLASLVGHVNPGDVSRTRCEPLAREANRLLAEGGETGPVLKRDPRVAPERTVADPAPAAA